MTTAETTQERTGLGNYFVANYPPFSSWKPAHLSEAVAALRMRRSSGPKIGGDQDEDDRDQDCLEQKWPSTKDLRYADRGGRPLSNVERCNTHARETLERATGAGLTIYDERKLCEGSILH